MFLDLTKAFDYAVRELVLGWLGPMASESASQAQREQHLLRLGVPEAYAASVADEITRTGGLLAEVGVDEELRNTISSLRSGAWFQLRGDNKNYLHSVSGWSPRL